MPFAFAQVVVAAIVIRLGQMLMCTGATRSNSAAGACARLLIDLAVATLALWAIGAIWVPDAGETAWLTFSHAFGVSATSPIALRLLPVLIVATGAVVGATQDRIRLTPLLVITFAFAAVVVPVLLLIEDAVGRNLAGMYGAADTGIGLASVVGGSAALAAAWATGQRKGKFNRDLSANVLPGHHVPMQYFGVLTFAAGLAFFADAANVLLGVSAATLAGAAYGKIQFRKIDTSLMLASTVSGAAAAATIGGLAPTWAAVLAGVLAGGIAPFALMKIETGFRIDDAGGSAAGLLAGGVIGLILAPLCADMISFGARLKGLIGNGIVLAIAAVIAAAVAVVICRFFKARNALRPTEGEEFEGVDLSEFDLNAYPDFQQTMIKSHHLRQI